MIVVAGPSGSGKSRSFPVTSFDVDAFNIDDRCALEHGSYVGIPPALRLRISQECERFVDLHIRAKQSFAVETTLRTLIAVEQAAAAAAAGFRTNMFFLSAESPDNSVDRVFDRAAAGGHGAPPEVIRATYSASLRNLPEAVRAFHSVVCYDTTVAWAPPREFAEFESGTLKHCVRPPAWFEPLFAVQF